ncbi:unnamed protein product [Haemonchus placei]|uniref:Uncharacterized protein n=1 Tax=Haemonchus placei TaxID=6290 RepID=A0A0N4WNI8_HAEPC|nr:unnamed protein product [Haemonchus placei]
MRQRGIARSVGNHQQTSELAKLCREATKEDLEEKRAGNSSEAAESGKSIREARRSFVNYRTKMTSLRRPDGTVTASQRTMEKVTYVFCSDLFSALICASHVHLPTNHLRQDGYVVPSVLPSGSRHAITSTRNGTAPASDSIKAEHLKSLSPVIVRTLARSEMVRLLHESSERKECWTSYPRSEDDSLVHSGS